MLLPHDRSNSSAAAYPTRQPPHLAEYDYSRAGAYFVTIRSYRGTCLFGSITGGTMRLSDAGTVIGQCWLDIPHHFPVVTLDCHVVMPNHVHGILLLQGEEIGKLSAPFPSLSTVVGSFKSAATKQLHVAGNCSAGPIWQRGYYEHVILRTESLDRIRQYIVNNPAQWELDADNPDRTPRR